MKYQYQLFVSGTPGDYESFPKGDEHASDYCKQFFNLPSNDTYHSADYYVELFPTEKLAYYTMMHRKNVSSTRENAYFALTLQFSGCYVDEIKAIFFLLETVFNKFVLGNVLENIGVGEKYKCQSLASFEVLRKKAEDEMGSALIMLEKSIKEFDSSFLAKRQPRSKQLWFLDEGKQAIIREVKSAQKMHLISTSEGLEELGNKTKEQINSFNAQIQGLNVQITEQTTAINDLKTNLSSAKQTIIEKDGAYTALSKAYKNLEEKLKNVPKPTSEVEFRTNVLASLHDIERSVLVVKEQTKPKEGYRINIGAHNLDNQLQENQRNDWRKKLPWGLLLIATILCVWFAFRGNDGDTNTEVGYLLKENDSLTIVNNKLSISLDKSQDSISYLRQELQNANATLQGIRDAVTSSSAPTEKPPFLDVEGAYKNKVALGFHKITPRRMPTGADWVVKTCSPEGCVTKDEGQLKCNSLGTFTIIVKNGDEEIETSARTFTIIEGS